MPKKYDITIGLTGNPNVGKSTLFNTLTGSKQHVGNWPGKTVEKKTGNFKFHDNTIQIVDLPGAYSLTAYTEEETVTSDFILQEKPNVVVQVIDAQNFTRNLFVTVQLIELSAPLILAINMADLARSEGFSFDLKELSKLLGLPVIEINAKTGDNINKLNEAVIKKSFSKKSSIIKLTYGTEIDDELTKLNTFISKKEKISKQEIHWLSLKLLEGDYRADQELNKKPYYLELKKTVQKSIEHLELIFGKDINSILTSTRYGFINGLCKTVVKKENIKNNRILSNSFDNIAMHKIWGIPLFLFTTWLLFQITFKVSKPLMGLIETFFSWLGEHLTQILTSWGASNWTISLFTEGIIGGVGGVLIFIPIIGILFLLIALLEDSGYMARVAYIMDKFMHKIGLHGKAFIPLILGFGCNVPGIMATRTLETKKDRLLTMLINPFMSCGARLPVYALFTGAFFSAYQGWIIFSLYLLGIIVAIIMGLIFKKFLSQKLSSPFVIELPPYRLPSIKGLLIHAWERIWLFIKKAGTIILVFSVIIWALASLPMGVEYGSETSWAGSLGKVVTPVFKPLGFGNWQSSVALIFGFVAKEVVVGTFGTLYGIEDAENNITSLHHALQQDFTPLSSYAFMVFVLLYVPCMAVLAVIKRETNSWKWMFFVAIYTTTIAWLVSFIIYQGGRLLGLE